MRSRRQLAITALTIALAVMFLLPAGAGAFDGNFHVPTGGITLDRNCSDGLGILDSSQCSFNVAAPSGTQEVSQYADADNSAYARQELAQGQLNIQAADAGVRNTAFLGAQISAAANVPVSGSSTAYGHESTVIVPKPVQVAVAGPIGSNYVSSDTGNADITQRGDTIARGGNSSIDQDIEAEIEGGKTVAVSLGRVGGDGGNGGFAIGGDSGKVWGSGDSAALDAALGAALARGGRGGDGNSASASDEDGAEIEGANGGGAGATDTVTSGDAYSTGGASTTGSGGAANGGAGAMGGAGTQTTTATGGATSGYATGTATSGTAGGGIANGHLVEVGGNTGGNVTYGYMAGGLAANTFGVTVQQEGAVTSTSGPATNSGAATSTNNATFNQGATPTVTQTNTPGALTASNTASPSQTAGGASQTANPRQTVRSGDQRANGSAESEVSVKLDD